MTTFICVLFQPPPRMPSWSGCYDASWVDKLYRGCRRHYKGEFDFLCLHDGKDYEFGEPVRERTLLEPEAGWATLIEAWRPDVAEDRVCVLGLDTVITGDITDIVGTDCEVGLLNDPIAKGKVCNGIGTYSRDASDHLWNEWTERRGYWESKALYGGKVSEMAFLRLTCANAARLDDLHPGQILSYKCQVKGRPEDARIVYFHGNPKPHQIREEWIVKEWI